MNIHLNKVLVATREFVGKKVALSFILLLVFSSSQPALSQVSPDAEAIYGDWPQYVAPSSCPSGAGTETGTSTPGSVFLFGDSIAHGIRDSLAGDLGEGWSVDHHTEEGKHLSTGIGEVDGLSDRIATAQYVVVIFGTNNLGNPSNEADIATMVTKLREANATTKIFWVDINVTREDLVGGAELFNAALDAQPDITVLDNSAVLRSDGYHPSDYASFSASIASQIKSPPMGSGENSNDCICTAQAVVPNPNAPLPGSTIDPESGFTKVNPAPFTGSPITPTGIVLHWTGGSPSTSVEDFVGIIGGRGLSVQLYIDGAGVVYQLVDQLNTLTGHAAGANSKTIGIEIAAGSQGTVESADEEINSNPVQKQAVIKAVSYLMKTYNIPVEGSVSERTGVLSHHLISPGRKSDVGDRYYNDVVNALKSGGQEVGGTAPCPGSGGGGGDPESNKVLGEQMARAEGWTGDEWACLLELWTRESSWNHNEQEPNSNNPISSAYGIPQALVRLHKADIDANYSGYYEEEIPGSGGDSSYEYKGGNPEPQIRWGFKYIKGRYSTPCGALAFHDANNWY